MKNVFSLATSRSKKAPVLTYQELLDKAREDIAPLEQEFVKELNKSNTAEKERYDKYMNSRPQAVAEMPAVAQIFVATQRGWFMALSGRDMYSLRSASRIFVKDPGCLPTLESYEGISWVNRFNSPVPDSVRAIYRKMMDLPSVHMFTESHRETMNVHTNNETLTNQLLLSPETTAMCFMKMKSETLASIAICFGATGTYVMRTYADKLDEAYKEIIDMWTEEVTQA